MRFAGQAYELTVPFANGGLDGPAIDELCRRFETEHLTRYGHAFSGEFPVEVVNLRLVGSRRPDGAREIRADRTSQTGPTGSRAAYFGPTLGSAETPVAGRSFLTGTPTPGPLVIEEYEGTTVVPPDCSARLDGVGNLVIERLAES
jgi:N-methylhydantoinase A